MFVAGIVLGVIVGYAAATNGIRGRAIEANVAEWQIDPKTGAKEFVWVELPAPRAVMTRAD
jgi:hypothetical protein